VVQKLVTSAQPLVDPAKSTVPRPNIAPRLSHQDLDTSQKVGAELDAGLVQSSDGQPLPARLEGLLRGAGSSNPGRPNTVRRLSHRGRHTNRPEAPSPRLVRALGDGLSMTRRPTIVYDPNHPDLDTNLLAQAQLRPQQSPLQQISQAPLREATRPQPRSARSAIPGFLPRYHSTQ
jgi:hypothetical protein